jgi:uroporphyrinogen-III synthase
MDPGENQETSKPTVVVTRAANQNKDLINAAKALGYNVIARPTIEITSPDDMGVSLREAIQKLESYEWVILTSANGAIEFAKASQELAIQNYPKIAVIGSATEKTLNSLGLTAELRPNEQVAEGLIDIFPNPTANKNLLLPVAMKSRETLPKGLKKRGWNVHTVYSYKSIKPKQFEPFNNHEQNADSIIFTSPSTVRNFIEMYGRENIPNQIISIGPVTTEEIKKNNFTVCRESTPHDSSGILESLYELINTM